MVKPEQRMNNINQSYHPAKDVQIKVVAGAGALLPQFRFNISDRGHFISYYSSHTLRDQLFCGLLHSRSGRRLLRSISD